MQLLSQPALQQKSEALAGFPFSGIPPIDACTWGARDRGGLSHRTATLCFAQPLLLCASCFPPVKGGEGNLFPYKICFSIALQELTASSGVF